MKYKLIKKTEKADKQKKNYTQRTIYGTFTVFIFSVIAAFFAYLLRILLAKNLSLADFGLFYSMAAFVGIFNIFRELGLSQAAFFYVPRYLSKNQRGHLKGFIRIILSTQFFAACVISSGLIIFSGKIMTDFFHSIFTGVLIIYIFAYFFNSIELSFQSLFAAFHNPSTYSFQSALRNFLVLLVAYIGLKVFGTSIYVPVIAQLIVFIGLTLIFVPLFFRKHIPDFFSLKPKIIDTKQVFLFGLGASVTYAGYFLITYLDTLSLTYFRSLEEVGLYSGVMTIVNLILFLPIAVNIVIMPLSSELWAKKKYDSLKYAIKKITTYLIILLVPIVATIILYSDLILKIFFGEVFSKAGMTLIILAFGAIFLGLGGIFISILTCIRGPKIAAYISLTAAFLGLIMNLLLVPNHGINGAAVASVCAYIMYFILSAGILYKSIHFELDYIKLFFIIVFGGFFVYIFNYAKTALGIMDLFSAIILFLPLLCVYFAMLFVTRLVSFEEIKEIRKQLKI